MMATVLSAPSLLLIPSYQSARNSLFRMQSEELLNLQFVVLS